MLCAWLCQYICCSGWGSGWLGLQAVFTFQPFSGLPGFTLRAAPYFVYPRCASWCPLSSPPHGIPRISTGSQYPAEKLWAAAQQAQYSRPPHCPAPLPCSSDRSDAVRSVCLLGHGLPFTNLLAAHDASSSGVWTQEQVAALTAGWPECAQFLGDGSGEEERDGESTADDGAEVSVDDEYE